MHIYVRTTVVDACTVAFAIVWNFWIGIRCSLTLWILLRYIIISETNKNSIGAQESMIFRIHRWPKIWKSYKTFSANTAKTCWTHFFLSCQLFQLSLQLSQLLLCSMQLSIFGFQPLPSGRKLTLYMLCVSELLHSTKATSGNFSTYATIYMQDKCTCLCAQHIHSTRIPYHTHARTHAHAHTHKPYHTKPTHMTFCCTYTHAATIHTADNHSNQ